MPASFAARRSFRGIRLFIVAALAVACFGALVLVSGDTLGWWIMGFGVVMDGLMILQAVRPGWSYDLGPEGISVRRATGTVLLKREEISTVDAVEGSRVEELVAGPQAAQVRAGRTMDFAGGMRARRELGRIVALSTVAVVLTQTRTGGFRGTRTVGARAPGRFVVVTLRDGSVRALSPRDVDGFVAAWQAVDQGA